MSVVNLNTPVPDNHPLLIAGFPVSEIQQIEMMWDIAWEHPESKAEFYNGVIDARTKATAGRLAPLKFKPSSNRYKPKMKAVKKKRK